MTEQQACTLCGAGGHTAAQCNWNQATPAESSAAHPEQAEGAQGELCKTCRNTGQVCVEPYPFESYEDCPNCGPRAALAQPSPKCATCDDNGRVGGPSFYAPDEGGDPCPDCAQPSPAPEVEKLAFVLRNIGAMDAEDIDGDNVDLRFEDADGRDTGCDVSIVEYAEKAADLLEQHDRIVGALRARNEWLEQVAVEAVETEKHALGLRDAAQARVAELEAHCVRLGQGDAERYWENRWRDEVAQAGQVPDGWRVMRCTSSAKREDDKWEIYDPQGSGGAVSVHDVKDWAVRGLLDALSAAQAKGE